VRPLGIAPEDRASAQIISAFVGLFTPVLAKHTKHLSLVDILSVGVDRMRRNFEPMKKQVEAWKGTRVPDETPKLVVYSAFFTIASRVRAIRKRMVRRFAASEM
jgi:hypothetical protein